MVVGFLLIFIGLCLFLITLFQLDLLDAKGMIVCIISIIMIIMGASFIGITPENNNIETQTEHNRLNSNYEIMLENDDVIIIKKK